MCVCVCVCVYIYIYTHCVYVYNRCILPLCLCPWTVGLDPNRLLQPRVLEEAGIADGWMDEWMYTY